MEKFMVALRKKFPDALSIVQSAGNEIHVRIGDEYYEETYFYRLRENKLVCYATLSVDAA